MRIGRGNMSQGASASLHSNSLSRPEGAIRDTQKNRY